MQKIRSVLLVIAVGAWLGACKFDLSRSHTSWGEPITDPSDPGFLDLSPGDHAISPWFGYSVEGRMSKGRRMRFFHECGDGERERLGTLEVDGFLSSIDQREAAYGISEDGTTLLYLHEATVDDQSKRTGLYKYVHGLGDEPIQIGARAVWVGCPPMLSVPRDTILFLARGDIDLFEPEALEVARARNTQGEESALLVWGGNALHFAVFEGDATRAAEAAQRATIEERTNLGLTPLHVAVLQGKQDMIRDLIECGADLDVAAFSGARWTALDMALLCRVDDVELDLLLGAGADVNRISETGGAPLSHAVHMVEFGPIPFAIMFVGFGSSELEGSGLFDLANLEAFEDRYRVAISSFDGPSRIEKLLVAGANPEIRDSEGNTALHRAVEIGNLEAIELLLQFGAQPDARGHDGATPLHIAKTKEVAELLLAYGASPDAKNDAGELPKILEDPSRRPVRSGRGRPEY